jgi:hypothetical protein
LLHRAGQPGTTAAQLRTGLFGDEEHCVTVRAEICLLRRVVGGPVTADPHRVADAVTLPVVPTDPIVRWG